MRIVALEWDYAEARILVARLRAGQVELEHALAVALPGERRTSAEIGTRIREALKGHGVGAGEAIVAVSRASIELRFLTVPPVPAEELPDLVRIQAMRQFSQPIEEGLLDYAPLNSSGNPPTSVLAAAITPELLKSIREVCASAQLTPKHLVLRPFAADSLVTDRLQPDSCVITVDRLSEEVDLTVVLGGQAVFPRSVRVGNYGTAEDQAANVVAEMRRTMAAAQNQIAGHPVERALLLGNEAENQALAEAIAKDLSLIVEFVDPLEAITIPNAIRGTLPTNMGRFAPLVGALVDEARARRHEIDFLAPRKRPVPPDRTRIYAVLGGVLAVAFLGMCGMFYWQLSGVESEIQDLTQQKNGIEKNLKAAKPTLEKTALIDEWSAGQVVWLDELKELASDLPSGDKVILDELSASLGVRPKIVILGGATSQSAVPALELKLGDERHTVRGVGTGVVPQNKPYAWSFRETIELSHPDDAPRRAGAKSNSKSPAPVTGRRT